MAKKKTIKKKISQKQKAVNKQLKLKNELIDLLKAKNKKKALKEIDFRPLSRKKFKTTRIHDKIIKKLKANLSDRVIKKIDISIQTKYSKEIKHRADNKRHNNFLITYTAIRSYDYNRPAELEIFTRSYPVLHPVTLGGFRKGYLQNAIQEEMAVFEKITRDQNDGVTWSNWIYEVKPGEEE